MTLNNKLQNEGKKKSSYNYIIPVFIGGAIGAVLGVVAYVKDWL
ncbi:integral membrane protein [Solibacillus silvestris StLB046]|uniref:Integral membrane protein n=1 Tax=Solibacillus silvestris (strain StLB046) TaxID=1002809 RepID=F2F0M7_SOLSS|nr:MULTISPECIES: hypothetical protein [Solibacillus]BAK16271.1 integral membrane protein [Solibacillus silvestris StLB046]